MGDIGFGDFTLLVGADSVDLGEQFQVGGAGCFVVAPGCQEWGDFGMVGVFQRDFECFQLLRLSEWLGHFGPLFRPFMGILLVFLAILLVFVARLLIFRLSCVLASVVYYETGKISNLLCSLVGPIPTHRG